MWILAWMHFWRPNEKLNQSDAYVCNQPMDRICWTIGLIGERLKEAEEESNPVGGPAVSINMDPDFSQM
jgi:hypothetical protein